MNLDARSSDVNHSITRLSSFQHSCRKEAQPNLVEAERKNYEAQLDYTIPEHLPNSPLCPRNPKYWRVVKHKGSQFRGCWMHGYGQYDVVPGLVSGGAISPE